MLYMYPEMKLFNISDVVNSINSYFQQPISINELRTEMTRINCLFTNDDLKNNWNLLNGYWNRVIRIINKFHTSKTSDIIIPFFLR